MKLGEARFSTIIRVFAGKGSWRNSCRVWECSDAVGTDNPGTLFSHEHVTEITLLVTVWCSVMKIVENLAYRFDYGIVRS